MTNFRRIASFVLAAVLIPALHTEPRRSSNIAGSAAQVHQLELGDHSAANLLAMVSNLRVLRIGSQALASVLGEDILVHFNVLIDNHNHEPHMDDASTMRAAVNNSQSQGSRIEFAQTAAGQTGRIAMVIH